MKEDKEERMRIRHLIYDVKGHTDNVTELFLLNRFPKRHESYLKEWIERLQRPDAINLMDNESASVYFAVLKKVGRNKIKDVEIVGEVE